MTDKSLIHLPRGSQDRIQVRPRWPSSAVLIAPLALERLQGAQASLPAELGLILTRGYEAQSSRLGWARKALRFCGVALFKRVYAQRSHELEEIFGANGHDVDGTHLDVSLAINGKPLRLLPLSVFTPLAWQECIVKQHSRPLALAKQALLAHGFSIHANATESRQIHCDLVRVEVA